MTSRVLIIGWDGADWRILDPLLERGALPNLAALIARGGCAPLTSTRPTHSWTAWPSFLTGVEPSGHGVYDILQGRGGSRQLPVTYHSIRERTFLQDLSDARVESLIVNVPLTFPPPAVHGRVIAGGVLPKWRTFTHPESLAAELERAGAPWPINGMSWTTYRNRPEPFLDEVVQVTTARQRAAEHLLDTSDWRVAVTVFFSTDRIQHCLSKYLSPEHPEYAELSTTRVAERTRDVYRMLDEGLGRLVDRTGPDDLVVFMSDHGFQPVTRAMHLDRFLADQGFLRFSASNAVWGRMQWGAVRSMARKAYDVLGLHGRVSLPQPVDWSQTKAYTSVRSTGEGVSINLAGREPAGIVDPGDFDALRDEIADRLASYVDPGTGKHPVARVWRREEVFKGPFADEAPDLVLQPAPLFSLSHAKSVIDDADWLSGEHRIDGVVAAAGPGVDRGAFASSSFQLVDLAPTLLAAVGVSSPVRHTGTALSSLVGPEAAVAAQSSEGADLETAASPNVGRDDLNDREAEEVEEHLRGLGYLE
jgi:predicted AlkP superfamily phosphohydrolase/phosphomutase